jgi:hypothetical protein
MKIYKHNALGQIIIIFLFILFSCNPAADTAYIDTPSGMKLEITVSQDDPKTILIQADAANAVNFELWIGTAAQAAAVQT